MRASAWIILFIASLAAFATGVVLLPVEYPAGWSTLGRKTRQMVGLPIPPPRLVFRNVGEVGTANESIMIFRDERGTFECADAFSQRYRDFMADGRRPVGRMLFSMEWDRGSFLAPTHERFRTTLVFMPGHEVPVSELMDSRERVIDSFERFNVTGNHTEARIYAHAIDLLREAEPDGAQLDIETSTAIPRYWLLNALIIVSALAASVAAIQLLAIACRSLQARRRRVMEQRRHRCAHCGYRLDGLTSVRCPECGHDSETMSESVEKPDAKG